MSTAKSYLFQANPAFFNPLVEAELGYWPARKLQGEMQPGDKVWIRLSEGHDAGGRRVEGGIYFSARITQGVHQGTDKRFDQVVGLVMESRISPPLLQKEIRSTPTLASAAVLCGVSGTNFRLKGAHSKALERVLAARTHPYVNPETQAVSMPLPASAFIPREGSKAEISQTILERIMRLSGPEWEKLFCKTLSDTGWEFAWVGKGRDRGVDIRATLRGVAHNERVEIQAKRVMGKVGPRPIRELRGSVPNNVTKWVVTNSLFTPEAIFAAQDPELCPVELYDGPWYVDYCLKHNLFTEKVGADSYSFSIEKFDQFFKDARSIQRPEGFLVQKRSQRSRTERQAAA